MNLRSDVSFRFLLFPLKSQQLATFLTIYRQIRIYKSCDQRFWKVARQTNTYVSNKWPLKSPCAYLNTQGSSPCGTLLIRIDDS
ncbi:hypothetical protein T12_1535 [Trichinella patagoniensis]|uniref:Uncharacterized protein n=1 Tax=Trichinella patagoniensis TaxID=990121 RepID=A0A0V1A9L6_9BILA|nr:hypothetical protein T12_1535 [Trichinella patagoniensis]